ncbi:MAG: type II secretion system protein, partial [Candidatus Pacebacteria bacterium]|nr:type II secretion system protein [Candidatus Paceibacterota bacterium]
MKLFKNKKGFTLIELLVVIAILGLLASIILLSTRGVRERGIIAKGLQFSGSIKHALGADIVGEWNFEDNCNDSTGNGNNGT